MIPDHLLERLACARPKIFMVLIPAFCALALVVTADYLTSYKLSLSPFYVLVILTVSWFCGPWWGALFACMSVFAQLQIRLSVIALFAEPLYFYISNGNKLFAYLVISFLASAVQRLYGRATAAARMDYLTGLINYLGFHERVSIELARHRRNGSIFGVAYIDCDNFKLVNDGLGHSEGDRVLQTVGHVLKSHSRETDIIARLGGDEFALMFPQTGEFEALQAINKFRQELSSAMTKHDWPITFSIGVGIFSCVPQNADRVIAFSDTLMYRVKASGKNKVMHCVYSPGEANNNPPKNLKAV